MNNKGTYKQSRKNRNNGGPGQFFSCPLFNVTMLLHKGFIGKGTLLQLLHLYRDAWWKEGVY